MRDITQTSGGRAVVTSMFEAAPAYSGGGGASHYATGGLSQDRIVRKEVALGAIREPSLLPENHIGLQLLAPWQNVESDDVIFDYLQGNVTGLAPARAEDAESELAQKDETIGFGRASIIDWALKDHYRPSDVSRYRELLQVQAQIRGGNFPLSITSMTEGFQAKVARDERLRVQKLYNRFEWLIMQAMATGGIAYNDGKIKFSVDYQRPAGQTVAVPTNGFWTATTSNPIADIQAIQDHALENYGVTINRALGSRKAIRSLVNTERFHNMLIGDNPMYTVSGWGPDAARRVVENQTNLNFIEYDSVYRTRAIGSTTVVNHRFFPDDKILFLPSEADIDAMDDFIGFGKTLTSPHPEGAWSPGFYEWERDTVDPWSHDRGTGCKAFPVFPHLDKTYLLKVLP
jgi:hypothetical protein